MTRFKSKILLESLRMPVPEVVLHGDFVIREPTQDELVHFKQFGDREYMLVSRIEPDRIKILEKAYDQIILPQELPLCLQKIRRELEAVLTALRLIKSGTLGYRLSVLEPLEDIGMYRKGKSLHSSSVDQQAWGEGEYRLEEGDLEALRRFWEDNCKLLFGIDQLGPLQIAIARFEMSYHKYKDADKLTDLMIAMEALYLKSGGRQKRHRLSHRAAVMLGSDKEDRIKVRDRFKDLYKIRSELVHGGPLATEIRDKGESDLKGMLPASVVLILKDYVRRAIREFLPIHRDARVDQTFCELDNEAIE